MRKVCRQLHLYLGLLSGIVVVVVCITGCLYVFKDEIIGVTEPWRKVTAQRMPFIKPSKMLEIGNKAAGDTLPTAITIGESTEAVWIDYLSEKGSTTIFLNPYTGKVIHITEKKHSDFDFFRFVLDGHLYLWLPRKVGRQVVGYGVLLFFITLITGIIIWLPKQWKKKTIRNLLTIKSPYSFSKVNYKAHTVLGFYLFLPLIVLCFTGLMFALDWFSGTMYQIVSGGKQMEAYELPLSDTLNVKTTHEVLVDKLYNKVVHEVPQAVQCYIALPKVASDVYRVSVVHKRNSYYRTDNLFFDRYTLKELKGKGSYAGKYAEASVADTMMRINLEIHDGRILGIFGKIIMCLASFIGASLPITGFIIWWKRKRHGKKKNTPVATLSNNLRE